MKKSKGIKIGVVVTLATICVGAVSVVGYNHYNKFLKSDVSPTPDGDHFDETKPVEDRIDEEQSQETKKDFDKIKENQPKPDDIVIPDDATEEDKEQLGVAKQYLTIFNSVNNVYKTALKEKNLDQDKYVMSEITDIYRASGAYVFNIDVIKEKNGKYFHSNVLLRISSANAQSVEELTSNSEKFLTGEIQYEFDEYLANREMNSKLFHDTDPNENRDVILDSVVFTSGDLAETPKESNILVTDGKKYTVINLYYWGHSIGKTYEQMQSEILSQQSYAQKKVLDSYSKSSIDWKSFLNEYKEYQQKQQEAQAQAEIEEISTRNENGNVTGFDWNAYTDLMKQKEAEKEAKELEQTATQQESVTYSDQELSL